VKVQCSIIVTLLATCIAVSASGQTSNGSVISTTLVQGDASKASNRINMIVFGDGYLMGELGKYDNDVTIFLNSFFKIEPYSYYQSYFNVYKVRVASTDSGVTQCDINPQITKKTYFSSTFGDIKNIYAPGECDTSVVGQLPAVSSSREMHPDTGALSLAVSHSTCATSQNTESCIPTSGAIMQVILANSIREGATAENGQYAIITNVSTDPNWVLGSVLAHESGHSLAYLVDEYNEKTNAVLCGAPPSFAMNIGASDNPTSDPWSYWAANNLPSNYPFPSINIGAYYPSDSCLDWYHATTQSLMYAYNLPFYQVNSDAVIKNIYSQIHSFPDGVGTPSKSNVTANIGDTVAFSPAMPFDNTTLNRPQTFMSYSWAITDTSGNQTPLSHGQGEQYQRYNLDTSPLQAGSYEVNVDVQDDTPALSVLPKTGSVKWFLNLSCRANSINKSTKVVSYTDPSTGDSCTQNITTIDNYDCQGNFVSETSVSDAPSCIDTSYTCVSVADRIVQGPTFMKKKEACHYVWDAVDYECSNGTAFTKIDYRQIDCSSARILPASCPVK